MLGTVEAGVDVGGVGADTMFAPPHALTANAKTPIAGKPTDFKKSTRISTFTNASALSSRRHHA
ncbi:MAG: hypothetical protein GIX01_00870 [Candidatus Eremiobacteraeota bacterium]|nr:hypothetical protein [Candidatus Eremiobacteraeota bacterium]